jgi:hypothetical protein
MVIGSWFDGFRRVLSAPAVLAGVFVLTLASGVPLALVMRGMIGEHLGRSLVAGDVADGVSFDWWQEFTSETSGLSRTFSPAIIGFASTLDNISRVLDGERQIVPVSAAAAVYLVAWVFISGGILDRYARQRSTGAHGFFGAAGVFFWRFLRLAAIAGLVYWVLFAYVHRWLLDDAYSRLTRDLAVEREAFFWRVALYALFGALLVAANMTFDYAKIRLVVEDRHSAVGALRAALGFIARHTGRVIGLYTLNALLFLVVVALWARAAPGAGGVGWMMWAGFAAAQLYLLARLLLKLQFMASQTALFQASLAHAAYAAALPPVWPESPAAEMIAPGPHNAPYR